jgi:RsiW-degrading membrane proteinase PrsW (M82 family)
MTFFLFLSGVFAPMLFWMLYFYYKDRYQPEPVLYMGLAYILGFASAWVCFKSYGLLPYVGLPADPSIIMDNNRLEFLIYCLGIVGPLEELLKFLPFLIVIFYFKPFNEKKDGIIYASVIALGFAGYENLHYLVYLEGFELIGRAIASPLTHGIFSSIWGYMVGAAKLTDRSILKATLIGLAVSAVFHGLFNFFTTSVNLRIGAAVVILGIWIWRLRKIDTLDKRKGKGVM